MLDGILGSAGLGVDYQSSYPNRRPVTTEPPPLNNEQSEEDVNKEKRSDLAYQKPAVAVKSTQIISGQSAQQVMSAVLAQVRSSRPWQLEEVQVVVEKTLIPSAYV